MSMTIAITGQALIHQPLRLGAAGVAEVLDFLKADATIGNFEGVVEAPHAWPTKTKTVHAVKEKAVASLAALGFTAMAHANNHAFDLGPPGIVASHDAMRRWDIRLAGSGQTLVEAARPVELTIGNLRLALFSVDLGPQGDIVYAGADRAGIAPLRIRRRIRLSESDYATIAALHAGLGDEARLEARRRVGYSPSVDQGLEAFGCHFVLGERLAAEWPADPNDLAQLTRQIRHAKDEGQIVLLALHNHHWDADWNRTPAWLERLAEDLVDAGADVIIGTGAPVMQPMRLYKQRAIAAGLGNFIFHTARAETYDEMGVDVWRSVAVRLTLGADGTCEHIDVLPIRCSRLQPESEPPLPLPADEAGAIHRRFLSRL